MSNKRRGPWGEYTPEFTTGAQVWGLVVFAILVAIALAAGGII